MNGSTSNQFLESELAELQVAAANFAQRFIPDAKVRQDYIDSTKRFSIELEDKIAKKQISTQMAAQQAHNMRNSIMNAMRGKTSDFGLALARFLKKEGKTLQQLEMKYAQELYQNDISKLTAEQKSGVWRKIVAKSGEPRVQASNGAKWFGRAGRGLFVLTVVISVYHIAKAEDKVRATANEVTSLAGGIAGASALGTAGLACGPAAIACVPLGIFIGGVVGALGADWAFDKIWD
jgi:CRISPR/Cas system CSM-associated protein Csm2 small subunit